LASGLLERAGVNVPLRLGGLVLVVVSGVGCGDSGSGSGSDSGTGTSTGTGLDDGTGARGSDEGSGTGPGTGLDDGTGQSSETDGDPCAADVEATETLVLTRDGPVQGAATDDGAVAFLQIPYAEPPTGELRFAAPVAPACWTEPHDATSLGPRCVQLQGPGGPVVGEEDCLHVNVWTPAADDGARPVMVFIHGGGNAIGSAVDPLYDGAKLAVAGDVVVVTLNYRLGALGWWTHPDLPAVNFGLRDQVEALRWVADNAAVFGGDPERVTIFGESAGAVNVCALIGSPLAAELFDGAIMQSGGCGQRSATAFATQVSEPFTAASGCADDDDLLACLRALPADAIATTEPTGYPSVAELSPGSWGPSLDPDSLPASSLEAMAAGTHNRVPTIIGANAEETAREAPPLTRQSYAELVALTFGPLSDDVLAAYPVADYDDATDAWIAVTSDAKFICGARRSLVAAAEGGTDLWRYHLTYDGYTTGPASEPAAFHGLELIYVFGNFDAVELGGLSYQPNPDDLAMAAGLQQAWTSFATDGSPTTEPAWPMWDVATAPYLGLDVPNTASAGVRTEQCDFWDGLLGG